MIDGNRYDTENLRISYIDPDPNEAVQGFAAENDLTAETGVYEVRFDESGHPISGGEYFVGANVRGDPAGGILSILSFTDEQDATPPVSEGVRVDVTEIFENDCGAKAILIRAEVASDADSGPTALPLLVKLENDKGTFHTWSSISRAGAFSSDGWLHDGPYFQDCIGPTGIESLELEGEVTVTFTLFDFAGNAAEPIVQVVQWPEELGPKGVGGSEGAGGQGGSDGGGGCSVGPTSDPWPWTLIPLALMLARRRRSGVSR